MLFLLNAKMMPLAHPYYLSNQMNGLNIGHLS